MSSETLSHEEAIGQFCGVTGADEERARGLLEACEWNLELAINMHVDTDPDGRSRKKEEKVPEIIGKEEDKTGNQSANLIGAEDDDDEIDVNYTNSRLAPRPFRPSVHFDFRRDAGASSSSSVAASTSAYQTVDSDGVRPPIAPVRQILNPNPIGYPTVDLPQRYSTRSSRPNSDIYDAFRDFRAEADWQEMALEGNVNVTALEGSSETNGTSGVRKSTLEDLFRPPLDLMFRGSLASSREAATVKNKWLLVNIQNSREFSCQTLNRDVWSNQTVKDIVKEHFIFWQVYHDSYEGQRYVQFYNVRRFPHVAIIDPRTGELTKSWPTTIDHNSFCDSVIEFLTEHSSPDGSGDSSTMKKLRIKSDNEVVHPSTLYDQSEEAQLEAAIKASLQETPKEHDIIEIDEETIYGPECKIALRFPDGSSLVQKFSANEKLSSVRSFVQLEKSATSVEFIAPPNRKLTESQMNETLDSLGLCPASRLETSEK